MWGPPLECGSEGGGGWNLRRWARRSVEGATAGRLAKLRAFFFSGAFCIASATGELIRLVACEVGHLAW